MIVLQARNTIYKKNDVPSFVPKEQYIDKVLDRIKINCCMTLKMTSDHIVYILVSDTVFKNKIGAVSSFESEVDRVFNNDKIIIFKSQ